MHSIKPRSTRLTRLTRLSTSLRGPAALMAFACVSSFPLHAQQTGAPLALASPTASTPSFFIASANPVVDFAHSEGVDYSSSSSSAAGSPTADAPFAEHGGSGSVLQPPPRRRYGRPRYSDNMHNADGSNKYAFIAGAGLSIPTGTTHSSLTPSYAFQVGGGRNFNKNLSLLLQLDYDRFGFNARTLSDQSTIYFGTTGQGLDGSTHVWSLSLNPVYNIYSSEGLGAYIVGGVGFYHKVADFTVPATQTAQDYFGNIYQYTANQIIDHYTSNAPGYNGGFGLTYKPSRFAGERFYVEARYVFISNQRRAGYDLSNINSAPSNPTNLFPANSRRTTYIPIKAGIRF